MSWIGDAADVFSAVGTVGTFTVAMYLLRQEQSREADRAEEERRSQATKVSAWLEAAPGGMALHFHVHNASDMPIYEVSLPSMDPAGEDTDEAEFIGLVPPGRTVTRPAPREWLKSYSSPEPVPLEFLDSSGRTWLRNEQGALEVSRG